MAKLTEARRLNFALPDGVRVGISIPGGVEPERLIAEYASIERQVAFHAARRVIRFDSRPSNVRDWLEWVWLCTKAEGERRAKRLFALTLGRRKIEARVQQNVAAFRAALHPDPKGDGE